MTGSARQSPAAVRALIATIPTSCPAITVRASGATRPTPSWSRIGCITANDGKGLAAAIGGFERDAMAQGDAAMAGAQFEQRRPDPRHTGVGGGIWICRGRPVGQIGSNGFGVGFLGNGNTHGLFHSNLPSPVE
ncbi:MAG: hypothetical protein KGQ52_06405 [Alphaproteobacteria bacterium]|nr:hypothetical protein [Alphaproteobacteria bacterium]